MLKTVKLKTAKGFEWITDVNGALDDDEIKAYFLGNVFDVGAYPKEDMQRVIKVEFLK